ncbi:MAG: hypothetical protein AMDU1_APLC00070G0010 [Thermoplasmatales archaeon A-plasma]|jgi:phage/plasmid-associated DNA primase|nr:MAG: hypothetical protein AMDU1_APLC00070G0010 [Thermoplasmatales archaeon A-plasma]
MENSDIWRYLSDKQKSALQRKYQNNLNQRSSEISVEKIYRLSQGLKAYAEYFSGEQTSVIADNLQGFLRFLTINTPGAKIGRLPLYVFKNFYQPVGEVKIAEELERTRQLMLKRAKVIHIGYDGVARAEIERLREILPNAKDTSERKYLESEIKKLESFLSLPGPLEIKNAALEEIANRLRARNVKTPLNLNRPPEGGIFRIALRDCTIEGYRTSQGMHVNIVPFNPENYLTFALSASLLSNMAAEQARQWWEYSVRAMGIKGARSFYEMVGYLIITKYPLPTERTILIIVGDPASGKGTHLAAAQEILTCDELTLFAKAGPHKLTDPREHFSRQNLQNKLALISGGLKHDRIYDFSEINDLFGGEAQEMEKKFKDPTMEKPTFKALWATTPPLFKIDQAGGTWRRVLMVFTNPVPDSDRDGELKSRMLSALDGFFLNGLIGLSYLVANGWKFTEEPPDAEIEETWTFYADSVRVWAQKLEPEPDAVETKVAKSSTLDGTDTETIKVENLAARIVVDNLYNQYSEWCTRKQIEPVKPKSFSAWLSDNGYTLKKKTLEEGPFKGRRKNVTNATWSSDDDPDGDSEMNRTVGNLSWEAYFSNAPLTIGSVSDSLGHYYACEENFMKKFHDHHVIKMPSWIGHKLNQSQETKISGSGEELTPRPIHLQVGNPQDQGYQCKPQPEPSQSNVQSGNSTFRRYRVLRDFEMFGRMYRAGFEFLSPDRLEEEVSKGNLQPVDV